MALIRALHRGEELNHDGRYFRVQDARIYTLPDHRIPIYVSGFGPQATRLAGRIGDGYCITMPDAERVALFREAGGGRKPVQAGMKVCWDVDPEFAADTAHRLWATEQLPGQLNQILPRPTDFVSAASLVPREAVTDAIVCGPDIDAHIQQVRKYVDAGVDGSTFSRSARTWTVSSTPGSATSCPNSRPRPTPEPPPGARCAHRRWRARRRPIPDGHERTTGTSPVRRPDRSACPG